MVISLPYALFICIYIMLLFFLFEKWEYFPKLDTGMDFILASIDD